MGQVPGRHGDGALGVHLHDNAEGPAHTQGIYQGFSGIICLN